jgi:predicted nucleotidyltransferase
MPVRSLNSPVLKWPRAEEVLAAAQEWARRVAAAEPDVRAIGCFGSYARSHAGVGSDLI